mmetsp:Transcript_25145/g.40622  ORF Transcript_25145/g.40622 Transcript_25145/m.40622 type:complete len:236 (+) Transcript_25145:2054-2761(+)
MLHMSFSPLDAAIIRAVAPSRLGMSGSALASRKIFATSWWSFMAAHKRGVKPSLLLWSSLSFLVAIRARTSRGLPPFAASMRTVSPNLSTREQSAFACMSISAVVTWFFHTASERGVSLSVVALLTLAFFSIRYLTVSSNPRIPAAVSGEDFFSDCRLTDTLASTSAFTMSSLFARAAEMIAGFGSLSKGEGSAPFLIFFKNSSFDIGGAICISGCFGTCRCCCCCCVDARLGGL